MLFNKTHALTGMLLLASCSAVSIAPAIAEPTQVLDNNSSSEMLVSQLLGHDTYNKEEQMSLSEYTLGKVRGRAGNFLSVELMDMTETEIQDGDGRVIMEGSANPGDDVLLKEEDGEYELVSSSHPAWITKLQENYKWKMAAETKGTALSERTASLWAKLKENEGSTVSIPEQEPSTEEDYPETVPEPEAEPVRGMW